MGQRWAVKRNSEMNMFAIVELELVSSYIIEHFSICAQSEGVWQEYLLSIVIHLERIDLLRYQLFHTAKTSRDPDLL